MIFQNVHYRDQVEYERTKGITKEMPWRNYRIVAEAGMRSDAREVARSGRGRWLNARSPAQTRTAPIACQYAHLKRRPHLKSAAYWQAARASAIAIAPSWSRAFSMFAPMSLLVLR